MPQNCDSGREGGREGNAEGRGEIGKEEEIRRGRDKEKERER